MSNRTSDTLRDKLKTGAPEPFERAETWKPEEPGDILTGTLEGTSDVETRYGEQLVSHLRDAEGHLWAVWHSHKVFREQWAEAAPQVGDRVGVCWHGMREGKDYTYHVYAIAVEPQESSEERRTDRAAAKAAGAGERREHPQEPPQKAQDTPAGDTHPAFGDLGLPY